MKIRTKIVETPIERITEYAKNNRIHDEVQVERIAESIKQMGFNQPLVLDGKGEIIVGHGRYQAALKLGLKSVPCVIADDLTEAQIRAYRILDNKLQNDSSWDFANLEFELQELDLSGEIDMEFFGLDDFLNQNEISNDEKEPDLNDKFEIYVEMESELKQKILYEELMEKGYKCKII